MVMVMIVLIMMRMIHVHDRVHACAFVNAHALAYADAHALAYANADALIYFITTYILQFRKNEVPIASKKGGDVIMVNNRNYWRIPRAVVLDSTLSSNAKVLCIDMYACADKAGLVDAAVAMRQHAMPRQVLNELLESELVIEYQNSPVVALRHWFKAYPEYNNRHTASDYPELQRQLIVRNGIYCKID